MASVRSTLQEVLAANQQKQEHFVGQSEFRVVVYSGELRIETENDLNDLINFRYAFDQQQFDTVVATVATVETTALEKFRLLFNESFTKAIKTIFY